MNFVLLINKEKNKTSRDMVNELNHIFDMKKIGHTGTLDPLATGILVMCAGKYTKLIDKLSFLSKEYIATIKIGIKTDTGDITGNVVDKRICNARKEDIINVLSDLEGEYEQIIPSYSAKKVGGKKLYEYARNGEEVPVLKNNVEIKKMELISFDKDTITFKCLVTKGTYIRSIIQSICDKLGIIGTMSDLIRTKQGPFALEDAYTIDEVKNNKYAFVDIIKVLDIPIYNLNDDEYHLVSNGCKIDISNKCKELLMVYKGEILAIYEKQGDLYKSSICLK